MLMCSLFIEYVVHLIHRESWQSALSIYESRAEVTSFCLELSKKLDMRYESPSIRVDLMTAASTGENIHNSQKQQRLEIGNTTDSTIRHDDISVSGSISTVKSMSKEIEFNAYHELIMMYNNNSTSSPNNGTTTAARTGSSDCDFVVDHQQLGGSKL